MNNASVHSPGPGQIYLDHVGWFVADMDVATAALERLGFVLSPFVVHRHADLDGGPPEAVGTGNRCAMLPEGYLEVLVSIDGVETPLARQHRAAVERYEGVHLLAFSVADAETARIHLLAEGFEPDEPAHLRRALSLPEAGEVELAFTVVRVPPGKMAEGRIQVLTHETPTATWHPRLLGGPAPFQALRGVLLCVDDPAEAGRRFGRFLGCSCDVGGGQATVSLDRGRLDFVTPERYERLLPGLPRPAPPPFIAAVSLTTSDLDRARRFCSDRAIALAHENARVICIHPGAGLGAAIVVHEEPAPWPPPEA